MLHDGPRKLLGLWLGKIFIFLLKAASVTLLVSQDSFGSGLIVKTTNSHNGFGTWFWALFSKCLLLSLSCIHRSIHFPSNEQNRIWGWHGTQWAIHSLAVSGLIAQYASKCLQATNSRRQQEVFWWLPTLACTEHCIKEGTWEDKGFTCLCLVSTGIKGMLGPPGLWRWFFKNGFQGGAYLCTPNCPRTLSVHFKLGLKFTEIHQPLPPECWD